MNLIHVLQWLRTSWTVRDEWRSGHKKRAVGLAVVAAAHSAGAIILWYDPWVVLRILPVIIRGIEFVLI